MTFAQKLLSLLGLCCWALTWTAPAAAGGLHIVAHAQSDVPPGEIHEHDDESAAVIEYDQNTPANSPDAPEGKFSHSHMSSPVVDLTNPTAATRPDGVGRTDAPRIANTPALGTLGWSPPVRPPRTA